VGVAAMRPAFIAIVASTLRLSSSRWQIVTLAANYPAGPCSRSTDSEIYPCDEGHYGEGAILANRALAHRNDEFPAGYSSAG